MSENFKREIRYDVVKLKTGKKVNCVVVEEDWPEYEIVWKMLQDRVEGRPNELSATQQKLEAAEARIKASHEQEPVGYMTGSGMYKIDGSFWQAVGDVVFKWPKLYAAPVIPPDVAELQKLIDRLERDKTASAKYESNLMRKNAELTRKLSEQQAVLLRMGYVGRFDGKEELAKLLAEATSTTAPKAVAAFIADWSSQDKYGLTQHDQGVRWACIEIGETLAAAPQQKQTEVQMNKEEVFTLLTTVMETEAKEGLFPAMTVTHHTLLAFANACEKIGMEKAAKICDNQIQEYHCDGTPRRMEYVCAEEIRKGIE